MSALAGRPGTFSSPVDNHQQIINRFFIIINMPSRATTTCPVGVPGPRGAGGSEPSENRQTPFGNRQIGQPPAASLNPNPLPIGYRQAGICYGGSKLHQTAPRNRQRIVNRFSVIVKPGGSKSANPSPIHHALITRGGEAITRTDQRSGLLPIGVIRLIRG